MDADRSPLSFLVRRLPPAFERRVVVLAPGQSRAYDDAEWRGAIVVVERGQIELECLDGSRHCFGRGAVLWLARLPLRALHNPGQTSAVLVAVSRKSAGAPVKDSGSIRFILANLREISAIYPPGRSWLL